MDILEWRIQDFFLEVYMITLNLLMQEVLPRHLTSKIKRAFIHIEWIQMALAYANLWLNYQNNKNIYPYQMRSNDDGLC